MIRLNSSALYYIIIQIPLVLLHHHQYEAHGPRRLVVFAPRQLYLSLKLSDLYRVCSAAP